jgi:hypothetical protein
MSEQQDFIESSIDGPPGKLCAHCNCVRPVRDFQVRDALRKTTAHSSAEQEWKYCRNCLAKARGDKNHPLHIIARPSKKLENMTPGQLVRALKKGALPESQRTIAAPYLLKTAAARTKKRLAEGRKRKWDEVWQRPWAHARSVLAEELRANTYAMDNARRVPPPEGTAELLPFLELHAEVMRDIRTRFQAQMRAVNREDLRVYRAGQKAEARRDEAEPKRRAREEARQDKRDEVLRRRQIALDKASPRRQDVLRARYKKQDQREEARAQNPVGRPTMRTYAVRRDKVMVHDSRWQHYMTQAEIDALDEAWAAVPSTLRDRRKVPFLLDKAKAACLRDYDEDQSTEEDNT